MERVIRIKELVKQLNTYRDEYYNKNNPSISDQEYDKLFDELTLLEKETGTILSNSPTQTVGYTVQSKLNKSTHEHPMLSLDKTKSKEDLIKFVDNKDALLMFKLDGLTVCNTYENGKLIKSETRGDGVEGEDITENAKVFSNLPLTIPCKNKLVVFGEAIIDLNTFKEINSKLPENDQYKNPRNLCSGTVRQLDSKVCAERNVRFIAWRLVEGSGTNSFKRRLEDLNSYGFEVVPWVNFPSDKEELDYLIDTGKVDANKNGLPIDGLVVGFDDIEYGESLGMTNHHLRGQLAYKYSDDIVATRLTDIEWSMGKTGCLTPVALFKPCEIDGTTVERASLHNVSIMRDLDLQMNCIVNVYKANMIIPQIKSAEFDGNETANIEIPKVCPICGGDTKIIKDKETELLMCTNDNCKGKLLGRLTHFTSKAAMNIEGLSEATIEFLIFNGWVNNFIDLYSLDKYKSEWVRTEGFGKKSVENLLLAIEDSKNVKLENFIVALGIPTIGKSASKTISKYFKGSWKDFEYAIMNEFDFTQLDDFGNIANDNIYKWYNNYFFQTDDYKLLEVVEFEKLESINNILLSSSLENKSFCITGSLIKYPNRGALVKDIELNGGKVVSEVTKKTDYLITNDTTSGSSKNKKAKELNIPIINENQFLEMIK